MQKALKRFIVNTIPLALFLLLGHIGTAQDLNEKIPINPDVTVGQFDNGLTYYIRPNKNPENKVELRLVVNAGSILEDDKQQGLAHFLEHMNFNGTKNFEKNEVVSYLQSIGVEFGADLNANTSFDQTIYILPIPTDKEGNLDKGFQILEDWAHNALLTEEDIDAERAVVLEESRNSKSANMRMLRQYLPELMSGSRYAERLPIGKDEILKKFRYDHLRRFYTDWYRPDLMAVVVVGDIDKETAMNYLKKHFATLKMPANPKERFSVPVEPRTEPGAMVVTDKEATNYQLQLIFPSTKSPKEVEVKDYRATLVRGLMLQVLNRRLRDLSRSSEPPFAYAAIGVSGFARGYESLAGYTGFGAGELEKALMALTAEMKRAVQYGFTETEIELAKKNMLSSIENSYKERNNTESSAMVGELIRNYLEDEPIPGIEKEYAYYKKFVPEITAEELLKELNYLVSNKNTFTLVTGPEAGKDKLPTSEELIAMTQKGFAQEVEAPKEEKVLTEILAEKPRAGKVVSEERVDGLDAQTFTLSNGVKVTVKPTEFKSDEIILTGVKKGGSNNYGAEDINDIRYATSAVASMGYGRFSPTQLEKVLSGKSISAGADIGEISNSVSGSSTVDDLEYMLQLLYLKLTSPRIDKELFEAYTKKQKMQLQFLSANPQVSFIDTVFTTMYGNNPLAPSPIPKPSHFEKLDMNRAVEIYKKELSSADGYHFYIVGNVDIDKFKPLMETYLGGLPQLKKEPGYKDNGVRPIPGDHKLVYYKGTEAKSFILDITQGEAPFSEDFVLRVQALSEILNIRVIEELREKLGGIYGGGYRADVSKEPYENYSIGLQLPCGPENVDKLLTAADEVVKEIISDGPKTEDLQKVKSQWHEQHRERLEKNSYWSNKLEQILFWGWSKDHVLKYDEWIDKLTVKDIQTTVKTVFNKGDKFTAVLYPDSEKK